MNNLRNGVFYRITIGLSVPPACGEIRFLRIEFPDVNKKSELNSECTFFIFCDGNCQPPSVEKDCSNGELQFLRILNPDDWKDLGRTIKIYAVDATRRLVRDVRCVIQKCEKICPSDLFKLMGNGDRVIKSGFYRFTVRLHLADINKGYFLCAEFRDEAGNVTKKEQLTHSRTVFVLCDGEHEPPIICSDYGKTARSFLQILDPETLIDLGRSLRFSIIDGMGNEVPSGQCFVSQCEETHPPQWIPIPNDKSLTVNSEKEFLVRISDRKLGEIAYQTTAIEIKGVDIRMYGNKVLYKEGRVDVSPIQDGDEKKYLLSIKGGRLEVSNIRTVDVAEVQVLSKSQALGVSALKKDEKKQNMLIGNKAHSGTGVVWRCVGCCIALLVMTWASPVMLGKIYRNYADALRLKEGNQSACVLQELPILTTNTLSVATSYDTTKTNTIVKSVSSIASQPQLESASRQNVSSGGLTLGFIVVCLLHVMLYCLIMFLTVYSFRALKRHNKLNGDFRGVLEALRNERDKDKRKAMQKKILDDMIDTYLDKPSSED